jgi:hypothetical protein
MRASSRLGPANLALVSVYFAPVWGGQALRALKSPFGGIEDRAHAAAALSIREVFDFGLDGLMRAANLLAGIKLVIAAAFLAYVIEFARALSAAREPNRETINAVLVLAVTAVGISTLAAVTLGDAALIRLYGTQLLLVVGAVILITVERHVEQAAAVARTAGHSAQRTALPAVDARMDRRRARLAHSLSMR